MGPSKVVFLQDASARVKAAGKFKVMQQLEIRNT
jgi:hypothetical protein